MKRNNLFRKEITMICFLFFGTISIFGQNTIQGKITSTSDGETMIGVNIVVKGSSVGTISDIDGNFTIN
ncbi:MAG TPA: carboxypeptidase-like regulatory domain-containing protein, partial [Saprospiraceae bacterium]|nr:carboxypeptidase-like regulatory domain-containing protein [Saprospiraceae bacterium]